MATIRHPIAQKGERESGVPWYLWCAALAVTSSSIGGRWDVSWHESIGRDNFWTPAHMAIYFCGVLAGVVCIYLIFYTTFRKPAEMMSRSVQVLGFSAPLGAFLAAWGGVAMLTSAPFDNWWHNAYGLDVRIISPPHTLLMLGGVAIQVGSLLLIASALNRAEGRPDDFPRLQKLTLYLCGLILMAVMFFSTEFTRDILLHSSIPYIAVSLGVPLCMALASTASRHKWAATCIASLYTLVGIGFILILPLFPAQPKLGPVYQPVTHFVPPQFPLLLIVPAVLMDLVWSHTSRFGKLWHALISAPLFVLSLMAVEWPFATFLMTPAANNRFFATGYHPYQTPPWSPSVLRHFVRVAHPLALCKRMGIAIICAIVSIWIGVTVGEWMKKVQR